MLRALRSILLVGAVAATGGAGAGTYVVRPGDTLTRIAARHHVDVAALAAANGLADPDRVVAGATLVIPEPAPTAPALAVPVPAPPPPVTHVVERGDTLAAVARRYGTTVAALAAANGIADPHLVRIGARLTVPAATAAAGTAQAVAATTPPAPSARLPRRLLASPARLGLLPRFEHWAATYGVPAELLMAMTWVESGWQNHLVSPAGARGIGQLTPDTVAFVSRSLLRTALDPADPDHNIRMSARYLRWLLDQTGGAPEQALAGYYQGLRSVRERGLYPATRWYVATVAAVVPQFRPATA